MHDINMHTYRISAFRSLLCKVGELAKHSIGTYLVYAWFRFTSTYT